MFRQRGDEQRYHLSHPVEVLEWQDENDAKLTRSECIEEEQAHAGDTRA